MNSVGCEFRQGTWGWFVFAPRHLAFTWENLHPGGFSDSRGLESSGGFLALCLEPGQAELGLCASEPLSKGPGVLTARRLAGFPERASQVEYREPSFRESPAYSKAIYDLSSETTGVPLLWYSLCQNRNKPRLSQGEGS